MAHILIMPRQGNTVESCVIGAWRVKEGDSVRAETVVCDVETDKAAFEVPAGADGIVLKILHSAGDDVPVLAPIVVIGEAGEDYAAALGAPLGAAGGASAEAENAGSTASPQEAPVSSAGAATAADHAHAAAANTVGAGAASPRARNLASREGLPLSGLAGTGPGGRIIERDVRSALEMSPAMTQAAKAAGMSGSVPASGSGLGGRVTLNDLAQGQSSQTALPAAPLLVQSGEGVIIETPIKGVRKVISDRMLKSLAETAQFTLNSHASAACMQELRVRLKANEAAGMDKVTINDLILFAVSRTLPQFPFMNAHKVGEAVRIFERVHLGLAVDTPRGLLVPVIRNANLLTLRQISNEAKRLARAAQEGSAKPEEISGSTFTVTNLGSLGVESFTPVLNLPEVAILGVAGIELRAVAKDSASGVVFEPHIGFSLTINHQVVDGAPAARFLKALCGAVENIDVWLGV